MKYSLIVTIFIHLLSYTISSETKVSYHGFQLWNVKNNNSTTLEIIRELEEKNLVTPWSSNAKYIDIVIEPKYVKDIEKLLYDQDYTVTTTNLQKEIDDENPTPNDTNPKRKVNRLTWNYYHNLNDIYAYLDNVAATYPKFCTVQTIGYSYEKRPIKLLKISNGRRLNKAVFIEGGIHAAEWISPASITYIIETIITNYEKEPKFVKNTDWYFVPVLNPDGYEYSYYVDRLWRKSRSKVSKDCFGVDLNRNWSYDWNRNSSRDPCSKHYRGRKPFSEPETASISEFFHNNRNIQFVSYIALHSYGQYIIYPWGSSDKIIEDHEELNRIGAEAATNIVLAGGEVYNVGPAGLLVYHAPGISIDWARGVQGIKYTYTVELRDRGRYGYVLPAPLIVPTSQEALIAVKSIVKSIRL